MSVLIIISSYFCYLDMKSGRVPAATSSSPSVDGKKQQLSETSHSHSAKQVSREQRTIKLSHLIKTFATNWISLAPDDMELMHR